MAPRLDDLDAETVDEILIKHEASGVRILAAPQKPEMAENVTAEQFTKVLTYLRNLYPYVILDTCPILNDIILSAIDVCDVIVLVTTQEIPSIKNVRLFLDLVHTMGIGRERIVFTMNRFDKRIAITPERVGENLKQEVAAVIPLDERVVIPAVNRGVPFMLDNRVQPAAKGIFSLAEAVRARLSVLEVEEEAAGKR
jgi:pilus assembly protein CpaE